MRLDLTKISVIHVIGGGIIAGVVCNVFGGIVYTIILADATSDSLDRRCQGVRFRLRWC